MIYRLRGFRVANERLVPALKPYYCFHVGPPTAYDVAWATENEDTCLREIAEMAALGDYWKGDYIGSLEERLISDMMEWGLRNGYPNVSNAGERLDQAGAKGWKQLAKQMDEEFNDLKKELKGLPALDALGFLKMELSK